MSLKEHWESAYQDGPTDVSWYQPRPDTSLALIASTQTPKEGGVIDIGGGASTLVDYLIEAGYSPLAVLDLSASALNQARARLGAKKDLVEWFEADVTSFQSPHQFAIWHDRAVFHFLTGSAERKGYMDTLKRTLKLGGHVVIATFASDGPLKCSGLDIVRYDEISMCKEFGPDFTLVESRRETHRTPWQTEQKFIYLRFRHNGR